MQTVIIIIILLFVVGAVLAGGYLLYRRGLRYAKGIERGIKMVPILISLPPPSEDVEVGARDVREVIHERISQAEVLYNLIASTATKGFKSKFFGQRHIAFELIAVDGIIQFYAAVPVAMVEVVKQAILTAYPGASLEEVEDHNIFSQTGKISGTYGGELLLKQDYPYPIATFDQLKRNTMEGILNSLTSLENGDGAGIQILLRPAREEWTKNAESLAKEKREDKNSSSGFSVKHILQAPFKPPEGKDNEEGGSKPKQISNLEQTAADSIEEKAKHTGYEVLIRVVTSSSTASRAQVIGNNIVSSFSMFDAQGLNGFTFKPAKNMEQFVTDFIFRFFPPERHQMILNSTELSTIFHFPDAQFTQTSQVQRQYSKQVEGPSQLSQNGLLIGYNVYRGVKKQIRLSDDDRRRHVYIVGQTGTGKSVLLENMMTQDMRDGKGIAFIDPHGDAAEKLLGMVPKERSEDVIYFDPGDMEHPPGLNLFEYYTEDQKDFLIQEAINMLEKLYDPHQQGIVGPRYHHMFRNAALTVMADPHGGTFIDISKLFRDSQFVKEKLQYVEDKTVLEFWQKEMPQAQRSSDFGEMVSWFVSKFGAFLSNQMMRNIIGQSQSSFDLRDVMDNRKILIANLSKGRLGELNSMLLGMIFVMKFQAAAMSRANQPEDDRIDFSFYIDEFQNFSTESFAFILSEARKYHLNMIVANQFISQLSEEVREAVFGNVGTIISLRTGPNDADFLVKQFSPTFNDRDLVNLPNYHAAVRLMSQGLPTQPFNMTTIPPLEEGNPQLAQALKQLSNAKYGRPRQEVEDEIFERLSTKPPPNPYESLASSQGSESPSATVSASQPTHMQGSQSGQSGANKSGGSGSSFLDEWLAKRRSALGADTGQSGQPPQIPDSGSAASGTEPSGGASAQSDVPASQQAYASQTAFGQESSETSQQFTLRQRQRVQSDSGQNSQSVGSQTDGYNMSQEGSMTADQSSNTPDTNRFQTSGSGSRSPQPSRTNDGSTTGNQQDGMTPQNPQTQQSGASPQSGSAANVYQIPDQPSTAANSAAKTAQGQSDADQVRADKQPQPSQSNQAGSSDETVVQPPEGDSKRSAREELMSAINADETDTWVGNHEGDSSSADQATIGQQDNVPDQQPHNPAPPSDATGSVTGQTTPRNPQTSYEDANTAQSQDQSTSMSNPSQPQSQLQTQPAEDAVVQGNTSADQQPTQQTNDQHPQTSAETQSEPQSSAAPPGNESSPQVTQPTTPVQSPDEVVDPGDTITPDQTTSGNVAPQQPTTSGQPSEASQKTTDAAFTLTDQGGETEERGSPADQEGYPETDASNQDVPRQVASDLGVESPQEQQEADHEMSWQTQLPGESQQTAMENNQVQAANNPPELRPGEVYVDEEGNVHQG